MSSGSDNASDLAAFALSFPPRLTPFRAGRGGYNHINLNDRSGCLRLPLLFDTLQASPQKIDFHLQ
jgi:hypothetical protein